MKSTCFFFSPDRNPYREIVVASSISNRYNTNTFPIMQPEKYSIQLAQRIILLSEINQKIKLHGLSDRRLSAKWLPTFNFCGCKVPRNQRDGSLRPYSRFSRQEPLLFYQVAPQLYSRNWVDPVPDPLLFFSGSAGNRTRASGSVAKNSDH
jgi:hypothetical protein